MSDRTFGRRQLAREIRSCKEYFQMPLSYDYWYGYVVGRLAQACTDNVIDLEATESS